MQEQVVIEETENFMELRTLPCKDAWEFYHYVWLGYGYTEEEIAHYCKIRTAMVLNDLKRPRTN